MKKRASLIPLLVVSCDKYADVWPHFFRLLQLRWPDCPFPILLGSNQLSPVFPGVTPVPVGPDSSWSTGAKRMLDRVLEIHPDADYVLLFLEDFFLKSRVDTENLLDLVSVARTSGVGCLRLAAGLPLALPPTSELPGLPGIGLIAPGDPYRITLQAAVWRIESLRRLLAPGLSAWEFEQIGTQMSEWLDDAVWAVYQPAIDYDHAVEKGKWKPAGLAILREAGLDPGPLSRQTFSESELTAHFHRVQAQSSAAAHRSAAFRSFLAGHRLTGLRHMWHHFRRGKPTVADFALGLVGLLGGAATKSAFIGYLRLRLWTSAKRARNED